MTTDKLIKFKKDSIPLLNFVDTNPKTFIIHFKNIRNMLIYKLLICEWKEGFYLFKYNI